MTKNDLKDVQTEMKDLKTDLQTEMKEIKADMNILKNEFKTDLKDLEHRLTIRLGLMLTGAIGIMSAINTFKH
jgi:DNA-binding transcriptional regulator GbsR (MarR family)